MHTREWSHANEGCECHANEPCAASAGRVAREGESQREVHRGGRKEKVSGTGHTGHGEGEVV
eukprot:2862481-Pleurochrysis_carterae.AAC.1